MQRQTIGDTGGCQRRFPVVVDGVTVRVKCNSRIGTLCESCARTYYFDVSTIGLDGIADAASGDRYFFFTATQPSHGATHSVPRSGSWVELGDDFSDQGSVCSCGRRHTSADGHLVGVPVSMDEYRYEDQFRFNYSLPGLLTQTMRRVGYRWQKSTYFVSTEAQRRGAMHLHGLIRVPNEAGRPTATDIADVMSRARATDAWGDKMGWGNIVVAEVEVRSSEYWGGKATGSVKYVDEAVRYIVKEVCADVPDATGLLGEHLANCDFFARDTQCPSCPPEGGRCAALAHSQHGARGHRVKYSRGAAGADRGGWSLTGVSRRTMHEERVAYAVSRATEVIHGSECFMRNMPTGPTDGAHRSPQVVFADIDLDPISSFLTKMTWDLGYRSVDKLASVSPRASIPRGSRSRGSPRGKIEILSRRRDGD
jgi:hypothetical protein